MCQKVSAMASIPRRPSSPRSLINVGILLSRRSPLMPPSTTTCATWMPSGPYSRAMLCEIMRRPALAAAKCANPGLPRMLAEAPVKMTVPPERHQTARCLAPDHEAAEAADAPKILELLRGHLAEIDALIVGQP